MLRGPLENPAWPSFGLFGAKSVIYLLPAAIQVKRLADVFDRIEKAESSITALSVEKVSSSSILHHMEQQSLFIRSSSPWERSLEVVVGTSILAPRFISVGCQRAGSRKHGVLKCLLS